MTKYVVDRRYILWQHIPSNIIITLHLNVFLLVDDRKNIFSTCKSLHSIVQKAWQIVMNTYF